VDGPLEGRRGCRCSRCLDRHRRRDPSVAGVGWLEALLGRQQIEHDSNKLARTNVAIQVLAELHEHGAFRAAALSVANELATRLNCSRVSIGFAHRYNVRVIAISHSAIFNQRTHIVSAIENAMEEAAEQRAAVAVPAAPKTARAIALAHEELARHSGAAAVLSVVMTAGGNCSGVILLERDRGTPSMTKPSSSSRRLPLWSDLRCSPNPKRTSS
jgi:hypothetical protein